MKNKLLLSIISLLIASLVYAQELKLPTNIQSPNAASLGKYGDVPVSYFTGTPNINIPLHKLSVRGIDLDISLSYDASGIRINSHPGWVGQNWSLNAGGVITRSVVGIADELLIEEGTFNETFTIATDKIPLYGYFYKHTELAGMDFSFTTTLVSAAESEVNGNNYDYEPDIFTFNFMGISGKFFMDNNGEWKVVSDQNLKVIMKPELVSPLFERLDLFADNDGHEYDNWLYPKVIGGFELIDDNGTIYKFGYDQTAIEYSTSFFSQSFSSLLRPSSWIANAWYLTEVTDKFGNVLYEFSYTRNQFTASFYRNSTKRYFSLENDCGFGQWLCLSPGCANESSTNWEKEFLGGSLISPVYLNEIRTLNNEKISFDINESEELKYDNSDFYPTYANITLPNIQFEEYQLIYLQQDNIYIDNPCVDDGIISDCGYLDNLKWYKLYSLKIYNSNTKHLKTIEFEYNDNENQRLNLLQLNVYANDKPTNSEANKYSYKFGYNNFDLLPDYLSRKLDHWGFYNGIEYVIEDDNLPGYYYQREPDAYYLKFGMLDHIIYPTGGYTNFIYEPNYYSQYVSNERDDLVFGSGTGGGLRIKKIIDFDGEKEKTRTFKYVENYENNKYSTASSGVLTRKPKYLWENWHVHQWDAGYNVDYYASTFSVNSMVPLSNVFGPIVGYSEVVEVLDDGSFTIYKYTNYSNDDISFFDEQPINSLNPQATQYSPYSELGILRGKLKELNLYDNSSNPVQRKIFNYRYDIDAAKTNYAIATDVLCRQPCPSETGVWIYFGNAYKLYYFDYDVVEEQTIDYLNGEEITSTITYNKEDFSLTNNNVRLLRSFSKNTSEGNSITTEYTYPLDASSDPFMQDLIDNNRIGEIIQTETSKNGVAIGARKTIYKEENGLLVPGELKTSMTGIPELETEVTYDKYDNIGNLLHYYDRGGVKTSFIWGYENQYPIAKIENEDYANIQPFVSSLQSASDNDNDNCFSSETCQEQTLRFQLNTLRDNLPGAKITSYTYDRAIGVTSITQPNKVIEYYSYDNFNRLQKVYDSEENFLKRYEYDYIDRPYIGMSEIEYNCNTLELGEPITFYTKQIAGVGGLNWTIKKGTTLLDSQSGSSDSFTTRLTNSGTNTINCSYTDEYNFKTVSKEISIYVSEVTCKFIDIQHGFNQNVNQTYVEARMQCPLEDVVTLSLLSQNTEGADFYIDGDYYHIDGYGSQTVEVSVANQSETSCIVLVPEGSQGFASLTIVSLENNTTSIGSPYSIEPNIQ